MPNADEHRWRRIQREELRACERSPDLHHQIRRSVEGKVSLETAEALLEKALAASPSVPAIVDASRCALRSLDGKLASVERDRVEQIQKLVLDHHVGPSVLKAEIYRLARHHQAQDLLDSTWFDELFERSETRRLTDSDGAINV